MHSSKDFLFLKKAGYTKSYDCIDKAMSYYYSDQEVCCSLFRKALESIISDVYSVIDKGQYDTLKEDIDHLRYIIPDKLYNDNIILEMTNIRIIGNAQIHDSDESLERDVQKDAQTSYIAMKKIADWLVSFANEYPRYVAEQQEKEKKKKEKRKKVLKGTLVGSAIVAGIAGLIAIFTKRE